MPISILMPALSPTMTEGNLVKWYKKVGDPLKAGDVLADIETDKATMEVEVVDEGILGKILIPEGTDSVPVNTCIGLILEEGESADACDTIIVPTAAAILAQSTTSLSLASELSIAASSTLTSIEVTSSRIIASPVAKKIAHDNNLDLHAVHGSGPRGRIVKADVEQVLHSTNLPSPVSAATSFTDAPVSNMRKVIARRLTEAKQTVPHFYLTIECVLDELLALRQKLNTLPGASTRLSVNDFMIRASALALMKMPEVNVSWHDTYIRSYKSADVSVAVSIEGGLITPVLRNAQDKSIIALSKEMKELAEKARSNRLKPEDYQGGTFSLSNLGMYGVTTFQAILNPPQSAILAIGAAEKKVIVASADAFQSATVMSCTLSVDHRAVDGAVAAQFLKVFKELIEHPLMLLAS